MGDFELLAMPAVGGTADGTAHQGAEMRRIGSREMEMGGDGGLMKECEEEEENSGAGEGKELGVGWGI